MNPNMVKRIALKTKMEVLSSVVVVVTFPPVPGPTVTEPPQVLGHVLSVIQSTQPAFAAFKICPYKHLVHEVPSAR